MATTSFREDFLGKNLTTPTSNSLDSLGRATTSTTDYMGRSLRRIVRANTTAVSLNQELQFTGGEKFIVVTPVQPRHLHRQRQRSTRPWPMARRHY